MPYKVTTIFLNFFFLKYSNLFKNSGLYYKLFKIYDRNAIGQYYKTMIIDYDRSWGSLVSLS